MTVIIIHKSQLILAILILATQGSLAKFANDNLQSCKTYINFCNLAYMYVCT